MKKLAITLAFLTGLTQIVKSQDFHLSMYDAPPMFLNPAFTGLTDANARVHAQYRNQWNAVTFKPFTTALISADIPKGKWGYGMQIINMRAGIGNYNAFQFLLSTAYSVQLDKNKFHNLSFGLQAGITQKSIREENLTFDEQYNHTNGGFFEGSSNSGENFTRQSQILPQVNAGLVYYYTKQQSRLNPFIGVSGFNLTNSKETFFDQNNHLPLRLNFHVGTRININELLYVIPKILIMKQGKATEQTYAVDGGYYLKGGKLFLLAGYVFRTQDASVASLGFKKENYILKFGYDFNTSSLKTASKTHGAMEIAFTYLVGKEKTNKIKHCPRL
ncbi:MAG TPA: PorP/SprF family type IX secretion system membrane protein [Bacteroidia bacterium]|jgi:type IX secretion system PorP/SprF family membrane protein|nr:PorP/SprF family type IX secretion system membrane protein [Bacteroidia bacterium]